MTDEQQYLVKTPLFPLHSEVRKLLQVWDGTSKSSIRSMINEIYDQTGTPQNPVDWSNPDEWIATRLSGTSADLARKTWLDTDKTVNPRHAYGSYLFINTYALLEVDHLETYHLSDSGRRFLEDDAEFVRSIDHLEGLPKLLSILANHSPARRGDLLEEWGEFLLEHSKFGTASTIKDTLRRRILNLVERGFIEREGNTYSITDRGVAYAADVTQPTDKRSLQDVLKAVKTYNDKQTKALRERLGQMHPYDFESLIKDLLEAMDYEDVLVTKQSGDKGIDVVANFQFGITQIKEVVQVKRQKGSITRPVLDQLRGALPYHEAIRGTLITLGKFASSCQQAALFPGAAPITLIDGDKLIELILKHGIGIKKRSLSLVEIDETYFDQARDKTQFEQEVSE